MPSSTRVTCTGDGGSSVITDIFSEVVVVELLSHVRLFATPWTAACQRELWEIASSTCSQSLLKFMWIESIVLSNHLILCCPLPLLPTVFSSIRVFSNELNQKPRFERKGGGFHLGSMVLMFLLCPRISISDPSGGECWARMWAFCTYKGIGISHPDPFLISKNKLGS